MSHIWNFERRRNWYVQVRTLVYITANTRSTVIVCQQILICLRPRLSKRNLVKYAFGLWKWLYDTFLVDSCEYVYPDTVGMLYSVPSKNCAFEEWKTSTFNSWDCGFQVISPKHAGAVTWVLSRLLSHVTPPFRGLLKSLLGLQT